jgi:hypothetical protein
MRLRQRGPGLPIPVGLRGTDPYPALSSLTAVLRSSSERRRPDRLGRGMMRLRETAKWGVSLLAPAIALCSVCVSCADHPSDVAAPSSTDAPSSVADDQYCDGEPREHCLILDPSKARVGQVVTFSGRSGGPSLLKAIESYSRGSPIESTFAYFALELIGDDGCDLVAEVNSATIRSTGDTISGSFEVPSTGICFQSEEARTLTPRKYQLIIGCHACVVGTVEVDA